MIFCHYEPHPETGKKLERFVQNINYKYYEDGSFYDIINDILEQHPIPDHDLTDEEKQTKVKFENVLSQMHNNLR